MKRLSTTLRHFVGLGVLLTAAVATAQAGRTYTAQDEGRRFDDGSRVVCRDVEVQRSTSDPNRVAGTATGAIVGGLLGNQIGSGSGRKIATIGGAVAGGAVGRQVQGNRQEARGDRVIERRCERVYR